MSENWMPESQAGQTERALSVLRHAMSHLATRHKIKLSYPNLAERDYADYRACRILAACEDLVKHAA